MEGFDIYKLLTADDYYTVEDLRYNQKLGFLLSKDSLSQLFKDKERLIEENFKYIEPLPLKKFNSKFIFYVNCNYLLTNQKQYLATLVDDLQQNQEDLFSRNIEDILLSRVFSEIEGSLNVENVPTTHKRIKEIYQKKQLTDKNDVIIKNMLNAMTFIVNERPEFNKQNLYKLYCLLSKDCLDEEDRLKDGAYYRDDAVTIGGFDGADADIIDQCMDSLFAFANDPESIKKHNELLPHICHYYILYVHPYFDYNGRTARMVSFWLNYVLKINEAPLFMSEAINDNKKAYYSAIVNTRITNNDLTYFLGYVLETSIKYSLLYKNLENVKQTLAQTGNFLSSTEWSYLKKIISHNNDVYFNYKQFLEYTHSSMSKVGALKILNNFANYGILEKATNKKKESIFKVNKDMIIYKFSN